MQKPKKTNVKRNRRSTDRISRSYSRELQQRHAATISEFRKKMPSLEKSRLVQKMAGIWASPHLSAHERNVAIIEPLLEAAYKVKTPKETKAVLRLIEVSARNVANYQDEYTLRRRAP